MKHFLSCIIMLAVAFPVELMAQTSDSTSLLFRDFGFIRDSDPWLSGNNAAALTRYSSRNISRAEISMSYGKGGFVDYYQSGRTMETGAEVESFYRLSQRAVVYGKMSYAGYTGHNMAGSVFIEPTRMPFDIVEDSLSNAGKKHRDTYNLVGGVGIRVWRGLSLGARLDYTAADYAKYKDLRHKNMLMDMNITLGAYWQIGSSFAVGANYYYRRRTEDISFSTYGKGGVTYISLISYGAFMGRTEQFSANGYTGSSHEKPLVDQYNGGGFQAEWRLSPSLVWYNVLGMSNRKGYYGSRSNYTITYTGHTSNLYDYSTRLSLSLNCQRHELEASVSSEKLENWENTYLEVVNSSGASTYRYYDPVKSADKKWVNCHLGYNAYLGIVGEMPVWTFKAAIDMMHRDITAYDYPYYRRQNIGNAEGSISAERNIMLGRGVLGFVLGVSYLKGSGTLCEDLTYVTPSSSQTTPPSMDTYLRREYEYLTSSQYAVRTSVKYSFLFPQTKMDTYVKISGEHRKANETDEWMEGKDNTQIQIALGCTF